MVDRLSRFNEFKIFREMNYINEYNFPPYKTLNITAFQRVDEGVF